MGASDVCTYGTVHLMVLWYAWLSEGLSVSLPEDRTVYVSESEKAWDEHQ